MKILCSYETRPYYHELTINEFRALIDRAHYLRPTVAVNTLVRTGRLMTSFGLFRVVGA